MTGFRAERHESTEVRRLGRAKRVKTPYDLPDPQTRSGRVGDEFRPPRLSLSMLAEMVFVGGVLREGAKADGHTDRTRDCCPKYCLEHGNACQLGNENSSTEGDCPLLLNLEAAKKKAAKRCTRR